MNMNSNKIRETTLEELTTFKPNHNQMNGYWWATRNGNPIGLCLVPSDNPKSAYGYHYPLANRNKGVASRINRDEPPLFVPVAFWPKHPDESRTTYHSGDDVDVEQTF